ncbi:Bgt-4321 [Blumeria graminis f. sp. tritici]|uniref:Bgt-4321 n=2 Tax=Blumeria graminis f. sp. tritici TaxID=62690 RepID=A0A9X9QGM0_BLUGR|nr:hypothetical protein BGT96224_4321 [Blumeria graminis f. sp. tritici 96224]VDB94681.1 Bgt-4321 [Blumeria graminis f. sp. tritici]
MPPKVTRSGRVRGKEPANDPGETPSLADTTPNLPAERSISTAKPSKSSSMDTSRSAEPSNPEQRSTTSRRGGRGGAHGVTAAPTASRFKPKNVRRSATELAELARKEQERLAEVAEKLARDQARLMRGRGMQRGRGDAMGRVRGALGSASSIFGVVPEGLKKAAGVLSLRSAGGSSGGGFGGQSGSGSAGRFSVKNEGSGNFGHSRGDGERNNYSHFTPKYPGEDEDLIRIDIEHINLLSDDEPDTIYAENPKKLSKGTALTKSNLRPVRLHREEHKERVTIVNTAPSDQPLSVSKPESGSDDGLFVADNTRSTQNFPNPTKSTASTSLNDAIVKTEPGTEVALASLPPVSIMQQTDDLRTNDSSKTKVEIDDTISISLSSIPLTLEENDTLKAEIGLEKNPKQPIKKRGSKPVIQTEEDQAEYERHLEDVAILANELGGLQQETSSKTLDPDGDESMEDNNTPPEQDKKEGRLYLFQFPPVLPILFNPNTENKPRSKFEDKETDVKVKKEDEPKQAIKTEIEPEKRLDMSQLGDASSHISGIKLEEELVPIFDEKLDITGRGEIVHEEGFVGKLVVRESGRVELCWGGAKMLVGRGVDAGFLTTGVIVDSIERGPQGGGVPEGKALGMGQIMGKFIVTPDWMNMA